MRLIQVYLSDEVPVGPGSLNKIIAAIQMIKGVSRATVAYDVTEQFLKPEHVKGIKNHEE